MPETQKLDQRRTTLAKARNLTIAAVLAGILLYFSLRGIQWGDVWKTISRAQWQFVLLAVLIGTISLFLRSIRWRILLSSRAPVPVATAFWATAAGYFGNNFLPARAGELVRTLYISSRTGLPKLFVLTTALCERLSDGVALILISSVVLLTLPTRPGWFDRAARPFAVIGICGALTIAIAPLLEGLWRNILRRIPVSPALREKLLHVMEHVLVGARAFHDPGRLLRFSSLTIVIWLLDAFSTQVMMRSLGLHASLPVTFLLLTGLGLGSALPSTPGYVGIYQIVAVSVLTPFGFSRTDAIAFILMFQAINYVGTAVWGTLAFSQARDLQLRNLTATEPGT